MKSHRTDVVSLVFGLLFLAVAGLWLAGRYVALDASALGWSVVVALVVLGVVGIAAAAAATLRSGRVDNGGEPGPSPGQD
jgi:hypothetical protein